MQLIGISAFSAMSAEERNAYRDELQAALQELIDDAEPLRVKIAAGAERFRSSLEAYDTDFESLLSHYCQIEQSVV